MYCMEKTRCGGVVRGMGRPTWNREWTDSGHCSRSTWHAGDVSGRDLLHRPAPEMVIHARVRLPFPTAFARRAKTFVVLSSCDTQATNSVLCILAEVLPTFWGVRAQKEVKMMLHEHCSSAAQTTRAAWLMLTPRETTGMTDPWIS